MVKLPNVTLVCVDCIHYEESLFAINRSIEGIEFGKVLFIADRDIPNFDAHNSINVAFIDKLKTFDEYQYFMLKRLVDYIETDYFLSIQYDGYVLNPNLWSNEFLSYDYIGAPWWYNDEYSVGNGGFSLRTKKLHKTLQMDEFSKIDIEDDTICRFYGQKLKDMGFSFAPPELAERFSHEINPKYPIFRNNTFGFHGKDIHNILKQYGQWIKNYKQ